MVLLSLLILSGYIGGLLYLISIIKRAVIVPLIRRLPLRERSRRDPDRLAL